LTGLGEFPGFAAGAFGNTMPLLLLMLGMDPVKESVDLLTKAAKMQIEDMIGVLLAVGQLTSEYGVPAMYTTAAVTPFDLLGNTLRGTRGIMTDMYRNPEKLIRACDAMTPMAVKLATTGIAGGSAPFTIIPLHKGADAFMSLEQYKKFYWPSFKKLLLGIIDVGMIPFCLVEGSYDSRLSFIADEGGLPEKRTAWLFDQTDMKSANEKFGSWACIGGNVPASLFVTGTPSEMDEHCKKLIDDMAPGGGYFLAPGAVINDAKNENVHAYLESTKKYGVY
jgi:uroporphyrinogen-III decarboxylase